MASAPSSWKVADAERALWVLLALRATYGFGDAPLMFQLALICFLLLQTNAYKSVWDDNYLYWIWDGHHVLSLTAHVDDLQITGCRYVREWIFHVLTTRFGALKRQSMPYVHAGIQQERLNRDIIRLHQEDFIEKLELVVIDRKRSEDDFLDAVDTTLFRSETCSCLWVIQTRPTEASAITALQSKMKGLQVKDMILVNQVIKRLKRQPGEEKRGIYIRRLTPPLRLVSVSDAGAANKSSNYAGEGSGILLGEDRMYNHSTDKGDFLSEQDVNPHSGMFHALALTGTKAKRVSYSTSHAETNAAAATIPYGGFVGLRYTEPEFAMQLGRAPKPLDYFNLADKVPRPLSHDHFVDCMDLWELCCGQRGIPADKGQRLGILVIREERRTLRLRRLYHVRTHAMLVDLLTKHDGYTSKTLHELETSGHWTIDGSLRVRSGFGNFDTEGGAL